MAIGPYVVGISVDTELHYMYVRFYTEVGSIPKLYLGDKSTFGGRQRIAALGVSYHLNISSSSAACVCVCLMLTPCRNAALYCSMLLRTSGWYEYLLLTMRNWCGAVTVPRCAEMTMSRGAPRRSRVWPSTTSRSCSSPCWDRAFQSGSSAPSSGRAGEKMMVQMPPRT